MVESATSSRKNPYWASVNIKISLEKADVGSRHISAVGPLPAARYPLRVYARGPRYATAVHMITILTEGEVTVEGWRVWRVNDMEGKDDASRV